MDVLARGSPYLMACGGIFWDDNACHVGSFCDFMGEGNSLMAELLPAIVAIEKDIFLGWRKL